MLVVMILTPEGSRLAFVCALIAIDQGLFMGRNMTLERVFPRIWLATVAYRAAKWMVFRVLAMLIKVLEARTGPTTVCTLEDLRRRPALVIDLAMVLLIGAIYNITSAQEVRYLLDGHRCLCVAKLWLVNVECIVERPQ